MGFPSAYVEGSGSLVPLIFSSFFTVFCFFTFAEEESLFSLIFVNFTLRLNKFFFYI